MAVYRVVTVAREFGSGGGPIAGILARRLGWQLLDNELIERIASESRIDKRIAAACDERLDSWLHRLSKRTFSRGAFESVVSGDVFDAEAMATLSRTMIEHAAEMGNCVIVGRGAQCILQTRKDSFHTYIYGPMDDRRRRVAERYGASFAEPEYLMQRDRDRAAYVRHHYKCDWRDPHLYHAMLCAGIGEDMVVALILRAIGHDDSPAPRGEQHSETPSTSPETAGGRHGR